MESCCGDSSGRRIKYAVWAITETIVWCNHHHGANLHTYTAVWQRRFCVQWGAVLVFGEKAHDILSWVLGTCWPLCCEKASWPFSAQQTPAPAPQTRALAPEGLSVDKHWLDPLAASPCWGISGPLVFVVRQVVCRGPEVLVCYPCDLWWSLEPDASKAPMDEGKIASLQWPQ